MPGIEFREHTFLDNPRAGRLASRALTVHICQVGPLGVGGSWWGGRQILGICARMLCEAGRTCSARPTLLNSLPSPTYSPAYKHPHSWDLNTGRRRPQLPRGVGGAGRSASCSSSAPLTAALGSGGAAARPGAVAATAPQQQRAGGSAWAPRRGCRGGRCCRALVRACCGALSQPCTPRQRIRGTAPPPLPPPSQLSPVPAGRRCYMWRASRGPLAASPAQPRQRGLRSGCGPWAALGAVSRAAARGRSQATSTMTCSGMRYRMRMHGAGGGRALGSRGKGHDL